MLSLHELMGDHTPSYAILSYTFQNLKAGRASDIVGFSKIKGCCAQAALDGWEYA
jgi:hypothetical protein